MKRGFEGFVVILFIITIAKGSNDLSEWLKDGEELIGVDSERIKAVLMSTLQTFHSNNNKLTDCENLLHVSKDTLQFTRTTSDPSCGFHRRLVNSAVLFEDSTNLMLNTFVIDLIPNNAFIDIYQLKSYHIDATIGTFASDLIIGNEMDLECPVWDKRNALPAVFISKPNASIPIHLRYQIKQTPIRFGSPLLAISCLNQSSNHDFVFILTKKNNSENNNILTAQLPVGNLTLQPSISIITFSITIFGAISIFLATS